MRRGGMGWSNWGPKALGQEGAVFKEGKAYFSIRHTCVSANIRTESRCVANLHWENLFYSHAILFYCMLELGPLVSNIWTGTGTRSGSKVEWWEHFLGNWNFFLLHIRGNSKNMITKWNLPTTGIRNDITYDNPIQKFQSLSEEEPHSYCQHPKLTE